MAEVPWLMFILASLVLIATPGQDMVLVMSRSVTLGSVAGIVTAAGVSTGAVGHAALAALGLGALLRTSELAFLIFKFAGAAYLVYLGVQMLRAPARTLTAEQAPAVSSARLFAEGAICNLSNPKVALFYFAFLPQFVRPDVAHPTFTLLILGLVIAILAFLVKGAVGYFGGVLSAWLQRRPAVVGWIHRVSGVMLIGLGIRLAFERPT